MTAILGGEPVPGRSIRRSASSPATGPTEDEKKRAVEVLAAGRPRSPSSTKSCSASSISTASSAIS